ncbi:hypothetical protein V492_05427, partial [Pseudogymnoascus sp. VKM F-4246]
DDGGGVSEEDYEGEDGGDAGDYRRRHPPRSPHPNPPRLLLLNPQNRIKAIHPLRPERAQHRPERGPQDGADHGLRHAVHARAQSEVVQGAGKDRYRRPGG